MIFLSVVENVSLGFQDPNALQNEHLLYWPMELMLRLGYLGRREQATSNMPAVISHPIIPPEVYGSGVQVNLFLKF